MTTGLTPVRGMNDVLPEDAPAWQRLERIARETLSEYGYREMRLPLLERTELFKRSIGEHTDIVEKEMYSFEDRGGESVTLRPEATAGVVRAASSNGLLHNQRQKLWCHGPDVPLRAAAEGPLSPVSPDRRRGDRLQRSGRGCRADPDLGANLARLGISGLSLNLNTLGTPESRRGYRALLADYFRHHADALDEDSRRRLEGNPLRILDSKNPAMREVLAGAPLITDHLDAESAGHFAALRAHLDAAGVTYALNPRLVRGLDYYSRTVFEWVTTDLGSQDAVCSGGRYDGLVAQLGGEPTPAIGWALGQERIVELMQLQQRDVDAMAPAVYLLLAGAAAEQSGIALAERLRDELPGHGIETNCGGGSIKSQMKRADRSGALFALILGDDELARGVVAIRELRGDRAQHEVPLTGVAAELGRRLGAARESR